MLHGAVRLADHARADVLRIDTSAAVAEPGVVRVLTAADVPGELRVGLIHKDWPVFIPEGGRTSYLGDVLAFVVADDRATARRAAQLVEVEYGVLRTITDPVAALTDDEDAVWGLDGNVLSRSAYARGDVDAALSASAHVVSDVFQTQRIEHAFCAWLEFVRWQRPTHRFFAPGAGASIRTYWRPSVRNQICAVSIVMFWSRSDWSPSIKLAHSNGVPRLSAAFFSASSFPSGSDPVSWNSRPMRVDLPWST